MYRWVTLLITVTGQLLSTREASAEQEEEPQQRRRPLVEATQY